MWRVFALSALLIGTPVLSHASNCGTDTACFALKDKRVQHLTTTYNKDAAQFVEFGRKGRGTCAAITDAQAQSACVQQYLQMSAILTDRLKKQKAEVDTLRNSAGR